MHPVEAKLRALLELREGSELNERMLSVIKHNYMSNLEKDMSYILALDEERQIFMNTGKTLSKKSIGTANKTGYDKAIWVPLMNDLRSERGLSFEAARAELVAQYPTSPVPGQTWFKSYCKDLNTGSDQRKSSNNITNPSKTDSNG